MTKKILRRFGAIAVMLVGVIVLMAIFLPDASQEAYAADLYPDKPNNKIKVNCPDTSVIYGNGYTYTWANENGRITGSVSTNEKCTTTIKIKNSSGTKAKISFKYKISGNYESAAIQTKKADKENITSEGTYTNENVETTTTISLKVVTTKDQANTSFELYDFEIEPMEVQATFNVAKYGSYTVDGTEVTTTTSKTVANPTFCVLMANNSDTSIFLGWYDGNKNLISADEKYKLKITKETEIYAIFIQKAADKRFRVFDSYFDSLDEAITYARATTGVIVLEQDWVIDSDYEIPADITIQIPFDENELLYTNEPATTHTDSEATTYRTLTINEGVTLTVNGSLAVGGNYYAAEAGKTGKIVGGYGLVDMKNGSQIVVGDGGNLYAWGFISGNGSVTAKLGSTVYEYYQIGDFRGGNATLAMLDTEVFPFSQYFVQNIEVPLNVEAGAHEIVGSGVYAAYTITTTIEFIGENGMFNVITGSLTKKYDSSSDRVIYTINGEAEINSISLTVAGYGVNSKDYVLPINSNSTLNLNNGSELSVKQDIALLPGVEININNGANLIIENGTEVYVYDSEDWNGKNYVYKNLDFKSVAYTHASGAPTARSQSSLADAKICIDGTITVKGYMYTTADGANIYSTGTGKYIKVETQDSQRTYTKQFLQSGNTTTNTGTIQQIAITPAKLRNSNNEYANSPVKSETITYTEGEWTHSGTAESVSGKAATCTETGLTDGTKCSVCGETLSGLEEIPATNHKWGSWKAEGDQHTRTCQNDASHTETAGHSWDSGKIATAPTCTAEGVKTYTCSVCKATKTEVVSALGHNLTTHAALAPTCTATGWDAYDTCERCEYTTYVEQAATGHTEVVDSAVPAKCTATGLTEGKHCSVCKDVLVAQTVTKAAGHSWDSGKITTEATCTADGIKTYNCTSCTATKEATVKATGHNWSEDYTVDTAATCTGEGSKSKHCKNNCGQTTDTQVIEATGHSYGEWTTTKAATCTEAGSKAHKCTKCGNEETETISALGHDIEHHAAQAPTCTVKGWEAYDTCTRCDYTTYVEQAATGHTEVVDSAVPATCTVTGLTEGKHCSVCKDVLVAQTVTKAAGHSWDSGKITTEATCTVDGIKTYNCTSCTATKEETVKATGHNWSEDYTVDTAATCTNAGSESQHCSKCEATQNAREIKAIGHSYGAWTTTKAATCTETGTQERACKKCDHKETGTIAALDHNIEHHAAQAPTCTVKGWEAYDTCKRCDYTTYVEQAATGHTEVVDSAVPATCTATGLTEGKHCSKCNEVLTAQSEVNALGHNWNTTYTVDQAATCTATGTESIHCSACSETKDSRTIAATGHTYVDNKCTSCGATRTITSGGGGGGGAAAVVTVPTTPTTETIVSKEENKTAGEKATTTAIVESKVTNEKVTATVNVETSQKLIEKAVENKSAEVVLEIQTDKTAKTAEVTVPTQAITEIIEKTEADLVIKTGETQITLDKTGIEELAEKAGTTEAVKIEVNTVESKESVCQVNIEFATSSGKKVDIEKGKVSVTVTPSAELFKKSIVCVYIDENGIYHKVKGQKNADNTYTFIADKF